MTQSNAMQKFCLFCLIIVLVLAVNASAHVWTGSSTIGGTPAGDGTNWFDVDNWATDAGWYPVPVTIEQAASLPASSDMAMLFGNTFGTTATYGPAATDPSFNPGGPVVIDTPGAVASTVFIGVMEYQHATLNITSMGTLTVDTVSLGEGANYCVLNNDGTINVSGDFQFRGGGTKNGAATFNMNGGTLNIGGNIDMEHGSFGTMHLNGGTVTAAGLIFDAYYQDHLDITEGILILDGDVRSNLDFWTTPVIGGGGVEYTAIIAYGGAGTVMYDYNITTPGKTTVWAAIPDPWPADGATSVRTTTDLEWFGEQDAVSYDVYFGTSQSAVANAQRLGGDINGDGPVNVSDLAVLASQWLTNPGSTYPSADIILSNRVDLEDFAKMAADWQGTPDAEFKGNQAATTFDPGTLANNTTYYWRIDEVNPIHVDSPWKGEVWSFTTGSKRLSPEDFSIIPWSEPWRSWGPVDSVQTFSEIYDCGFNVADFVTPSGLDIAAAAGLKGIVYDGSLHVLDGTNWDQATCNQKAQTAVNSYGSHRALFGYYLRDEPGADLYPTLGRLVDAFYTYDPDHLSYINLFPNYANSDQMDVSTYQQYIDSYVSTVQTDYISYDNYAYTNSLYWSNLETIRTAAQNSGVPFWNIVCAVKRSGWPTPSPATLRFQLYTSLAYGAGGIGWYQYFNWSDSVNTVSGTDFSLAPIDQYGNKTNTWYYLQDVNLQMHQIGQTYITLNNVGVYHDSSPSGWSISGSDLLVGDFDQIGTGQSFVMVVNKSLTNSRSYSVSESLPGSGSVYYVSPMDGQLYPLSGSLTLVAGEGRLLTAQ